MAKPTNNPLAYGAALRQIYDAHRERFHLQSRGNAAMGQAPGLHAYIMAEAGRDFGLVMELAKLQTTKKASEYFAAECKLLEKQVGIAEAYLKKPGLGQHEQQQARVFINEMKAAQPHAQSLVQAVKRAEQLGAKITLGAFNGMSRPISGGYIQEVMMMAQGQQDASPKVVGTVRAILRNATLQTAEQAVGKAGSMAGKIVGMESTVAGLNGKLEALHQLYASQAKALGDCPLPKLGEALNADAIRSELKRLDVLVESDVSLKPVCESMRTLLEDKIRIDGTFSKLMGEVDSLMGVTRNALVVHAPQASFREFLEETARNTSRYTQETASERKSFVELVRGKPVTSAAIAAGALAVGGWALAEATKRKDTQERPKQV